MDWDLDPDQKSLLEFTSALIDLRKRHPVFRRRRFFAGDAAHGGRSELGDIEWFKPDGAPMDEGDWNSGFARSLMVFLNGDAIPELDHMGRPIYDDHFLLLFNALLGADQLHPAARRRSAATGRSGWTPRPVPSTHRTPSAGGLGPGTRSTAAR